MSNLSRRKTGTNVTRTGERFVHGFVVHGSRGTPYKISFDAAPGAMYWTCSCPGNIRHGQCKHLTAAGLRGRKFGHQNEIPTKTEAEHAERRALP